MTLRAMRQRTGRSQLQLATDAGVSQRHLSFLETGRSNPSREMALHLGIVLGAGLRERNDLLLTAGFAPVYAERSIDHPDLTDIRRALEQMLSAHEPYPAYLIDRQWNLVLANDAAGRLLASLSSSAQAQAANILRLVLHPDGLRTISRNWDDAAAAVLHRFEHEVALAGDPALDELLAEVRGYPGIPDRGRLARVPDAHQLLVPIEITLGGQPLSFFTTIATLAATTDVTLEELRIETLLPADAATDAALRS